MPSERGWNSTGCEQANYQLNDGPRAQLTKKRPRRGDVLYLWHAAPLGAASFLL